VIEFAPELCVVDPLDAVVEVLGEEVDEVAVEVGEDPVLDVVVEVLGLEVDVLCANTPADATSIDPIKHK
jgi:hypothetical protein